MKRIGIVALLACVIPPGAAATPQAVVTVNLGVHRFGHRRPPGAIVARVATDQVGWQLEGDNSGPETFLVGTDGSIWLHDEMNHRLLVWSAGRPDTIARIGTLPYVNAEDVALGPVNTLYFDRDVPELKEFHLYPRGARIGFSLRRAVFGDNLFAGLRIGPDGALYQLASSPKTGVEIERYSLAR
jgi:hypothetical protein